MSMKINDIYRSTEVQRWHIVKTKRKQSVAEHSFIVALLALELAEVLCPTNFNWPFSTNELLMAALFHDMDEVITGDIPSPAKKFISPDVFSRMRSGILGDYGRHVAYAPQEVEHIVKLADLAEAFKFITLNKDSPHAEQVCIKLSKSLWSHFDACCGMYPDWQWQACRDLLTLFLHGTEWTLDDYVGETAGGTPQTAKA